MNFEKLYTSIYNQLYLNDNRITGLKYFMNYVNHNNRIMYNYN